MSWSYDAESAFWRSSSATREAWWRFFRRHGCRHVLAVSTVRWFAFACSLGAL